MPAGGPGHGDAQRPAGAQTGDQLALERPRTTASLDSLRRLLALGLGQHHGAWALS